MNHDTTAARIHSLEKQVRALRAMIVAVGIGVAAVALLGASGGSETVDELVVRRLVVVDGDLTPRVVIGDHGGDPARRDHAAGILLFDHDGTERGGMVTFADETAVIALDAPAGVGAPMRDRLALQVHPDGTASVSLIGNDTGVPVRIVTDPSGSGGVEFLTYDLPNRRATVTRLTGEGESSRQISLDGN